MPIVLLYPYLLRDDAKRTPAKKQNKTKQKHVKNGARSTVQCVLRKIRRQADRDQIHTTHTDQREGSRFCPFPNGKINGKKQKRILHLSCCATNNAIRLPWGENTPW